MSAMYRLRPPMFFSFGQKTILGAEGWIPVTTVGKTRNSNRFIASLSSLQELQHSGTWVFLILCGQMTSKGKEPT